MFCDVPQVFIPCFLGLFIKVVPVPDLVYQFPVLVRSIVPDMKGSNWAHFV